MLSGCDVGKPQSPGDSRRRLPEVHRAAAIAAAIAKCAVCVLAPTPRSVGTGYGARMADTDRKPCKRPVAWYGRRVGLAPTPTPGIPATLPQTTRPEPPGANDGKRVTTGHLNGHISGIGGAVTKLSARVASPAIRRADDSHTACLVPTGGDAAKGETTTHFDRGRCACVRAVPELPSRVPKRIW